MKESERVENQALREQVNELDKSVHKDSERVREHMAKIDEGISGLRTEADKLIARRAGVVFIPVYTSVPTPAPAPPPPPLPPHITRLARSRPLSTIQE